MMAWRGVGVNVSTHDLQDAPYRVRRIRSLGSFACTTFEHRRVTVVLKTWARRAYCRRVATMDDIWGRLIASSVGSIIAETVTLPTDVVKTRLQVQKTALTPMKGASVQYTGMFDCMTKTTHNEGVSALWKGLQPALLRQVCYSTLALVLYEPIRDVFVGKNETNPTFIQRLLAGGTAGALSITVFNPTEVIKTQIQTALTTKSMGSVIRHVWHTAGVGGFWAGWGPNVARTFLVNAAELGVYDQAKAQLQPVLASWHPGFTHIGASGIAGFASAMVSTPADVMKTRLMNSAGDKSTSLVQTFKSCLRNEGVGAFYKGFSPIVVRKVIWCSVFFVSYENIRARVQRQGT